MNLTGFEAALLSVLGGIVLMALGYWLGGRGKQTVTACAACRESCQKDMRDRLASLERTQDDLAAEVARKVELLFRMVRSLIIHSDIPKDEQDRILNDRETK